MQGQQFKVLDDGFIRVVDTMGDDSSIVQAARISYGAGTTSVHQDRGLIRYLMRHWHSTPFEMCEIKLHVRVPMDAWRQWIRHRTANVNEYSTRYSEAIDEKQKTSPDEWRSQSKTNNQGSGTDGISYPENWVETEAMRTGETVGEYLSYREAQLHDDAKLVYEERLACGVAREQARKDLPLSTYTEAYWKVDLHNLLHFLRLRMDSHAQKEIRDYATIIGNEIVANWVPHTWEAFKDYRLESMQLTRPEIELLNNKHNNVWFLDHPWFQHKEDGTLKRNRERSEFEAKLERLGIHPWWKGQDETTTQSQAT